MIVHHFLVKWLKKCGTSMNPIDRFQASARKTGDNLDITWIGPNPLEKGVCVGLENGILHIYNHNSTLMTPIPVSTEAINGVAAIDSASIAISTRSEVTFIEVITRQDAPRVVFHGGAHGVVSTKSGYFIAPRGPDGLLIVKPQRGPEQKMRITTGMDPRFYFYRMTALHDHSGRETLVFANRRHGVGLSDFYPEQERRTVHTLCFDGLDVVDVCGIEDGSLSAIAISTNAEVLWIRDSSRRDNPVTTKLVGMEGTIYRVLATAETLFVLTDQALYAWLGLVKDVFSHSSRQIEFQPLVIPMAVIDISIFDGYLYFVFAEHGYDKLAIHDLELIPVEQSATGLDRWPSIQVNPRDRMEDFAPRWEHNESHQAMMAVV